MICRFLRACRMPVLAASLVVATPILAANELEDLYFRNLEDALDSISDNGVGVPFNKLRADANVKRERVEEHEFPRLGFAEIYVADAGRNGDQWIASIEYDFDRRGRSRLTVEAVRDHLQSLRTPVRIALAHQDDRGIEQEEPTGLEATWRVQDFDCSLLFAQIASPPETKLGVTCTYQTASRRGAKVRARTSGGRVHHLDVENAYDVLKLLTPNAAGLRFNVMHHDATIESHRLEERALEGGMGGFMSYEAGLEDEGSGRASTHFVFQPKNRMAGIFDIDILEDHMRDLDVGAFIERSGDADWGDATLTIDWSVHDVRCHLSAAEDGMRLEWTCDLQIDESEAGQPVPAAHR